MSKNKNVSSNTGILVSRQIDKYDGQRLYIGNQVVFELSSYLGGGASGSVYQSTEFISQNISREVAVKILNPIGFKTCPAAIVSKCIVVSKGLPLNQEQLCGKAPMTKDNVWWIYSHNIKQALAAFEDPNRSKQLREMTLSKCVDVWGFQPFGEYTFDECSDKHNIRPDAENIDGMNIFLPHVPHNYLKWLRNRSSICREMSNMLLIGEHPNIIDLCEVLELIQDSKTTLFLVLELASGGMLFDRIKYSNAVSTEDFARKYFTQLLSGIEYCHEKGVVHRDLKPENLLLSDSSDSAILKIADFGFSAVIFASESSSVHESPTSKSNNQSQSQQRNSQPQSISSTPLSTTFTRFSNAPTSPFSIITGSISTVESSPDTAPTLRRLKSVVGSPHYIAPEISNDDPMGYDGRKVDMWSAGVILYSLLTGSLPFAKDLTSCARFKRYKSWIISDYAIMLRDNRPIAFPNWFASFTMSPLVCSLLVRLLHPDPSYRLSVSEALQHPWSLGQSACDLHELTFATASISMSDCGGGLPQLKHSTGLTIDSLSLHIPPNSVSNTVFSCSQILMPIKAKLSPSNSHNSPKSPPSSSNVQRAPNHNADNSYYPQDDDSK